MQMVFLFFGASELLPKCQEHQAEHIECGHDWSDWTADWILCWACCADVALALHSFRLATLCASVGVVQDDKQVLEALLHITANAAKEPFAPTEAAAIPLQVDAVFDYILNKYRSNNCMFIIQILP